MSVSGSQGTRRPPLSGLVADYRPPSGAADELLDGARQIRPVWREFLAALQSYPPDELAARFTRADQHLHDAGVYYRQYDTAGSVERDWPLNHIPVLLDEREWQSIVAALTQRADLLEAVVADLYGPCRLVDDGHLPAALIASSREWLRPLVGVLPASDHFLHFLAFEIGRGPNGDWWVLGDRAQAPSGAGFALENRIATGRAFPELFAASNVHRLAGFFRDFRDALQGLRGDPDALAAILTPGPLNDTYFEHAYIARYLGAMLLEGKDLTVENGRVMVRTVSGPKPVSVLWRRLDASFADPLELDERSQLGTPGLVDAIRRKNLTMVNALGSGILEIRALMAFLPRICVALTGEALKMSNIATWWCGQEKERRHVAENAAEMMIAPARSTRLPFEAAEETVRGRDLRPGGAASIREWLEAEGGALVGQEAVRLSTTPTWVDGRLAPRPMVLRVFMARTAEGWRAMPGGFARIGRTEDAAAIALQRGGSVADVWVVSETPVARETMLARPGAPYLRTQPGVLPSRAADNLYWLGRYVERAEGSMRLLRAYHRRLMEARDSAAPMPAAIAAHLEGYDVDVAEGVPVGLRAPLEAAVASAGAVRDRFSEDGWMALTDLKKTAGRMARTVTPGEDAARAMSVLLRKATGFSGLVHDNMYRFTGWRFLGLGRAVERAIAMAAVLARFADDEAPDGSLDLAIEFGDSILTHRQRYAVASTRETVVDLLALDGRNPRSILRQLTLLREHVEELPGASVNDQMSMLARAVLQVHTALAVMTPDILDSAVLRRIGEETAALSDLITATYLR